MHAVLFLIPILSAIVLFAWRLVEMGTRREIIRGEVVESLTLRLFITVGTLVFLGSIAEYVWRNHGVVSWPLFWLGWIVGLSSILLRRRAILVLGKFWSLHVEIRAEHQFVHSGPFQYVRHPAYLSMVLELMGVPILCRAFYTLALFPLLFLPVLLRRIRIEEAAMVKKFGDVYRNYQRTVPALLPGIW